MTATAAVRSSGVVGSGHRAWTSGVATGIAYCFLAALTLASLYPLVLMAVNSFKGNNQVAVDPAGLPRPWTLSGYKSLINEGALRSFGNSLLVAGAATMGSVFISGLAAYAFAKLRFPGRTVLFAFLLGTIMIPIQTALPGFYTEFARFHWINTYQIQIVPFLAPVFGVFIARQYLLSVPDEFIEAARIDGASEWRIYWRVIVPILKPVLAALAILQFLMIWNSYLWPQVMASTHNVAPISVTLPTYVDTTLGIVPLYGTIMAGNILATIPLLIIFLRYQDLFMKGVAYGAS
jgi:ABC-type glycerol-3-phosphate transport system permease component